MSTNKTTSNKTKAWLKHFSHHPARTQKGPQLQLLGLHGSIQTGLQDNVIALLVVTTKLWKTTAKNAVTKTDI